MQVTETSRPVDGDEALSHVFASTARVAVLKAVLLDPSRPYYQRQLEMATGLQIRAVQRELERLTRMGLLYRWSEGNRAYYQVDTGYFLYPELRGMVLKASSPLDRFRGNIATNEGVRLAVLSAGEDSVLVVTKAGMGAPISAPEGFSVEVMDSEAFLDALNTRPEVLTNYLSGGSDLLGRRDDVLWRHIESGGYSITKGDGVP